MYILFVFLLGDLKVPGNLTFLGLCSLSGPLHFIYNTCQLGPLNAS